MSKDSFKLPAITYTFKFTDSELLNGHKIHILALKEVHEQQTHVSPIFNYQNVKSETVRTATITRSQGQKGALPHCFLCLCYFFLFGDDLLHSLTKVQLKTWRGKKKKKKCVRGKQSHVIFIILFH